MTQQTLIVGYGNTLRSDDGVGPRLAQSVAEWNLPHVRSLALHELVPEVADSLAKCDRVFFADAAATTTFEVLTLTPASTPSVSTHFTDPAALLALAQTLYGRSPAAWMLLLPAENFDLGETLSPSAQLGLDAALSWLRGWFS